MVLSKPNISYCSSISHCNIKYEQNYIVPLAGYNNNVGMTFIKDQKIKPYIEWDKIAVILANVLP